MNQQITIESLQKKLNNACLAISLLTVAVAILFVAWIVDGGIDRVQGKVVTKVVHAEEIIVQRPVGERFNSRVSIYSREIFSGKERTGIAIGEPFSEKQIHLTVDREGEMNAQLTPSP